MDFSLEEYFTNYINSDLSGRSFDVRRYNEHWILPHKIQETKQA